MGDWAFILEDVLARERQAYDDLQLAYDKTAAALGKEVFERDKARAERDDLAEALRAVVAVFIPSDGLTEDGHTEWAVHTKACDLLATLDERSES